jgi:hypothetical protein
MSEAMADRIERLFARDRRMAWVFVVLLWVTVSFVFLAVNRFVTDGGIRLVLLIAALAILVFNTASIVAMIAHYRADRDHIYGLDLRHLDEARARRAAGD